ncbi:Crp/Fnr family transcriptional regulator [Pedobacter namyangjuensis]|uniref:Crp/Fnr family transcriptional regulator n=1 Tax=Pedobacter namyangjuensis TaxID=600626 RepID=UPI000DE44964|nr:Crp/Fnr family transcriptional regulator [Pedobacter namyangjuensis]
MNITYFMNQLQNRVQLNEQWQVELKTRTKVVEVKKGNCLLYPDEICKHVYFIRSGFFRIFSTVNGIEETVDFAAADHFLTSIPSFLTQKNGKEGIICEMDGILLKLNFNDILALEDLSPDFLKLHNLILQEYLLLLNQEKNVYRTANATQKYRFLCKQYPGIANIISHKNIASYLGITPPTLSNLLKDLLTKDK